MSTPSPFSLLRSGVFVVLLVLGSSASAGDLSAGQPAIYLGFSLHEPGGNSQSPWFTADFGVQFGSRQLSRDAAEFPGLGRAPIFHLGVYGSNSSDVRVLGRSMLSQERLNAAEAGAPSSGNWIWWTLGAVAAGGAVAMAAGNGDGNPDSRGDCASFDTGVGDGGAVDPGNGTADPDQVDNSGCAGGS